MFSSKTFWLVLLVLWMTGSTWWHLCHIKHLCPDSSGQAPAALPASPPAFTPPALTISDGQRLSLSSAGNFSFAVSGADINTGPLRPLLDSLVGYLKAAPGKTLELTGSYGSQEQNATSYGNLGIARAESLKTLLVQLGIAPDRLTTRGQLDENPAITPAGDSLYGGIGFAFSGKKAAVTEEALAKAETYESVLKPIDLYCQAGSQNYIRTAQTARFIQEATAYLKQHKSKKLLLTGHTDDTGSEALNVRLSRFRATAVKAELVKAGVSADQIRVEGKGEAEPKAPNDTEDGRKANRRVTIVVL